MPGGETEEAAGGARDEGQVFAILAQFLAFDRHAYRVPLPSLTAQGLGQVAIGLGAKGFSLRIIRRRASSWTNPEAIERYRHPSTAK